MTKHNVCGRLCFLSEPFRESRHGIAYRVPVQRDMPGTADVDRHISISCKVACLDEGGRCA